MSRPVKMRYVDLSGEEVVPMGVKSVGEKYLCEKCGNEVVVTRAGGGTLVCCGEDMKKIEE